MIADMKTVMQSFLPLHVPGSDGPQFVDNNTNISPLAPGLIEIGDTILKIDEFKVNKEGDLFQALEQYKPGDVVKVTINRADLESPNSKSLRMTQKVLSIELKAQAAPPISQYLIIPPN